MFFTFPLSRFPFPTDSDKCIFGLIKVRVKIDLKRNIVGGTILIIAQSFYSDNVISIKVRHVFSSGHSNYFAHIVTIFLVFIPFSSAKIQPDNFLFALDQNTTL